MSLKDSLAEENLSQSAFTVRRKSLEMYYTNLKILMRNEIFEGGKGIDPR